MKSPERVDVCMICATSCMHVTIGTVTLQRAARAFTRGQNGQQEATTVWYDCSWIAAGAWGSRVG